MHSVVKVTTECIENYSGAGNYVAFCIISRLGASLRFSQR